MSTPFERVTKRQVKITRRRPGIPRELLFTPTTGLLSWKPPQEQIAFTHYRVRIDHDDSTPDFELASGQTSLSITKGAKVFVSTYNSTNQQESAKTPLQITIPEADLPGDVRPIGSDAFLITQADLPTGQKAITITYDPPDPISVFSGVLVSVFRPDGSAGFMGDFPYNGDPAATGITRRGTCLGIIPSPDPSGGEDWRFYVESRSASYVKPFVLDGGTGATPNRLLHVTHSPIVAGTTMPLAEPITSATVNVDYSVLADKDGNQFTYFRLRGAITRDLTDAYYFNCHVILQPGSGSPRYVGQGVDDYFGDWILADGSTYTVKFYSYNQQNVINPTPYVYGSSITLSDVALAPALITPTVEVDYGLVDVPDSPVPVLKYRIRGWWALDTGNLAFPAYAFTRVKLNSGSGPFVLVEESGQDSLPDGFSFETTWFDIGAPITYAVTYTPVNQAGAESTPQIPVGSPLVITGVMPDAPAVTSPFAAIQYQTVMTPTGSQDQYRFKMSWVNPTGTNSGLFGYCTPTAHFTGSGAVVEMGKETDGPPVGQFTYTDWFDLIGTDTVYVQYRSYNRAGVLSASSARYPAATTLTLDVAQSATPGDVTLGSIAYRYDPVGNLEISTANPTPPSPLGTFTGIHWYAEVPDQSTGIAKADGTQAWDGTQPAVGDKAPLDLGARDYDATRQVERFKLAPVDESMTIRLRAVSYSEFTENDYATSPSVTIAVDPPAIKKPLAATAYCQNATWAGAYTITDPYNLNGQLELDITFTGIVEPDDPNFSGWEIWSDNWPDDPNQYQHTGTLRGDDTTVTVDCPKSLITVRFILRSVNIADDGTVNRNPFVEGITPDVWIVLGTTGGTVDAGDLIDTSVGTALSIVDRVLGVAPSGITEDLIDTFAVSSAKIADGAVATSKLMDAAVALAKLADGAVGPTKIANLAVGNAAIANLAVDTAKIANGAITTAKIQNLAVTNALIADASITTAKIGTAQIISAHIVNLDAAKINAGTITAVNMVSGTLTLATPQLVTTINNAFDTDMYAGLVVKHPSDSQRASIGCNAISLYTSGGVKGTYIEAGSLSTDDGAGHQCSLGSFDVRANRYLTCGTGLIVNGAVGWTGTFATGDGRTATVRGGVIISVA